MLINHIKIALRHLRLHIGNTCINVAGLSIGIAAFVVIGLYVRDELSYDRFHKAADRIYRVNAQLKFGDRAFQTVEIPAGLSTELVRAMPAVKQAVRMTMSPKQTVVRTGAQKFFEDRILRSESLLFSVFDFLLVQGNPQTVLNRPRTLAISASTARRYFDDTDPLGQIIHLGDEVEGYEVTGVFADIPRNSHLQFEFVVSIETGAAEDGAGQRFLTFVLLQDAAARDEVEQVLLELSPNHVQAEASYQLQPLTDIYLSDSAFSSEPPGQLRGNATYVYLFSAIAVCILLLACVNYANLTTAQSAQRFREIGIRKTAGACRLHLVMQFLGESLLLCLGVAILAIGLIELILPAFNTLVGKELETAYLGRDSLFPLLLGVVLVVGVLAGSYPAFVLAAFQPSSVLKGRPLRRGASRLRQGLVVLQFTTFITLIIAVIVVQQQLQFTRQKGLGFNEDHIVILKPEGRLTQNRAAFHKTIEEHPRVVRAAYGQIPGASWASLAYPEGRAEADGGIRTYIAAVDYDFVSTLEIEVLAGRGLSKEFAADARLAVLLNETAAVAYGWGPEKAVGKTFRLASVQYTVAGVVRDYHFQTLKRRIQPLMMHREEFNMYRNLAVRIQPEQVETTLAFLELTWQQFITDRPFSYAFLDDEVAAFYRAEATWKKVLGYASFLVVVIACLGLLGLAAFSAERRKKEIGVRKILGATVPGLVALLAKEFLKLVIIALALASPIAWFAMNSWLADFAYRIELGGGVFALAGALALITALVTVSYQAVRAAMADPVENLRVE